MEKQAAFRGAHKRKQVLKGASTLNFDEFDQYDTSVVHDNECKSSEKVAKSGKEGIIELEGDHDVWVEKILTSKKSGERKVYFISKKTGRRVASEPPTGATRVFYLRDSFKEMKLSSKPSPKKKAVVKESPKTVATDNSISDSDIAVCPPMLQRKIPFEGEGEGTKDSISSSINDSEKCLCPITARPDVATDVQGARDALNHTLMKQKPSRHLSTD